MQKGRCTPPLLVGKRALGKGSTTRTPMIANTLLLTCGLNIIEARERMKIRWSINEGRKVMRKLLWLISSCVLLALGSMASAQNVPGLKQAFRCDYDGALCAEVYNSSLI